MLDNHIALCYNLFREEDRAKGKNWEAKLRLRKQLSVTVEDIARKLSESAHLELCKNTRSKKESELLYSHEDYWKRNKKYFIERARIYLAVKEYLGENNRKT